MAIPLLEILDCFRKRLMQFGQIVSLVRQNVDMPYIEGQVIQTFTLFRFHRRHLNIRSHLVTLLNPPVPHPQPDPILLRLSSAWLHRLP